MPRSITQLLVEALYMDAAENNRNKLLIVFDHRQLVFNRPDAFAKNVDPYTKSLVLNIHVNAAKYITWDEQGFSCELGSTGSPVKVYAPWSAFAYALVEHPIPGDKTTGPWQSTIPLSVGALSITSGVDIVATNKVENETKIETKSTRPTLKVVK